MYFLINKKQTNRLYSKKSKINELN